MSSTVSEIKEAPPDSTWTVFLIFLRLGLTSFGGPVAHLGYFRDEFVTRRRWLTENTYVDLVALCQFLPGPSSSQVGIALGLLRTGFPGAVAAWAGFTLPSAILLGLFAIGMTTWSSAFPSGILHGLKLVAVAVVAQAVWGMARNLCTDRPRLTIAAGSACVVLMWPNALLTDFVVRTYLRVVLLPMQKRNVHSCTRWRASAEILGLSKAASEF